MRGICGSEGKDAANQGRVPERKETIVQEEELSIKGTSKTPRQNVPGEIDL